MPGTGGIKCIPEPAVIYELLTPIALAYWIIGDGSYARGGVLLSTDSFSVPDVIRLINVLMIRYNLKCTLQYSNGKPRILISATSIGTLKSIVLPHMHPSITYKLGL